MLAPGALPSFRSQQRDMLRDHRLLVGLEDHATGWVSLFTLPAFYRILWI
jgi:hypothetical protein